jgi:transposase
MNNKTEPTVETKVEVSKIAIDMHLKSYRVVRKLDHGPIQPGQRFEPGKFYQWLRKEQQRAKRVVACYEAGCFGYEPARRMQALGVEVYVIAPQSWDERGRRQVNDKWDASVMCRRLSEYLDGNNKALSIVQIPLPEEEQQRAEGRFREQLCREAQRLAARGRSLLLQREVAVRGCWWRGPLWQKISAGMPAWVVHQLQIWKELLEQLQKLIAQEERQLCAKVRAGVEPLLYGEGELTHALVQRELLNRERFRSGRQLGNYFGLCPSEYTTGDKRRLGSITKHGNPRLRRLMIELAWRMVRLQPQYVALARWRALLLGDKAGAAARKRAIVAVARRLAIDLWRIATGRKTAQELGLRLKHV